jgi:DNA-binding HxlR family transcriptional regulator
VPKSYRYQLTDKGTTLVAALQAVRNATLERLDALAA